MFCNNCGKESPYGSKLQEIKKQLRNKIISEPAKERGWGNRRLY
jgi:hypothetical protein